MLCHRTRAGAKQRSADAVDSVQQNGTALSTRAIRLRHSIIGCASNKFIIKRLEEQLQAQLASIDKEKEANEALRTREKVLLDAVTTQGGSLHYIALAAFSVAEELGSDPASIAASLMQDIKVHELLNKLGSVSEHEPYTTQCMRAVITPERISQMHTASVQEIAGQLTALTKRMSALLEDEQSDPSAASSLNQVVDDYAQLTMLIHVAADRQTMEMSATNLDTMQRGRHTEAHWRRLIELLQLQPQQVQHLVAGFQVYERRSKPLVASVHELVQQIQLATAPAGTAGAAAASSAMPTSSSASGNAISSSGSYSGSGSGSSQQAEVGIYRNGIMTAEGAEALEHMLCELVGKVMQLRELHRTVTFLWINTLSKRQNAITITHSYPHFAEVLSICKLLSAAHAAEHQAHSGRPSSKLL